MAKSRRSPVRVLWVDDDARYVASVLPALSRSFTEVVHTTDPVEAWQKLTTGSFGLVILEVLVQEPPAGLILCRRIRAEPTLAGIPVLVLSDVDDRFGFGLKDHLDRDGFLPADDFLDKGRPTAEIVARALSLAEETDGA